MHFGPFNEITLSYRLRRGIVERSLWITLIFCITIIGCLIGAVFYYKIQAEKLRKYFDKRSHSFCTILSNLTNRGIITN